MRRPKRGEIAIREVPFSKADFEIIPEEDRALFFMAAQTANELAILRSLIMQALDAAKGDKLLQETGLGVAFFLARLLAGRVTEGWENLFRSDGKDQQFQRLWEKLPGDVRREAMQNDVEEARKSLANAFDAPEPLLRRVRHKLAFHLDRPAIVGAFNIVPESMPLNDFHTGMRGTTFYGGADTIMALAASYLIGSENPSEGMDAVIQEASRLGGELSTIIDAYLVAFVVTYFGVERLRVPERIVRVIPEGSRSKLRFYFDHQRAALA